MQQLKQQGINRCGAHNHGHDDSYLDVQTCTRERSQLQITPSDPQIHFSQYWSDWSSIMITTHKVVIFQEHGTQRCALSVAWEMIDDSSSSHFGLIFACRCLSCLSRHGTRWLVSLIALLCFKFNLIMKTTARWKRMLISTQCGSTRVLRRAQSLIQRYGQPV